MATRRVSCRCCQAQLVMPVEAQATQCPVCQTTQTLIPISRNHNGYNVPLRGQNNGYGRVGTFGNVQAPQLSSIRAPNVRPPPMYNHGYYRKPPLPVVQQLSSRPPRGNVFYQPPPQPSTNRVLMLGPRQISRQHSLARPQTQVLLQPTYLQTTEQVSPLSVHGKKRAVLCGVSYHGQTHNLAGSVGDVRFMRSFLVERMGFPDASVLMLTEEESNPSRIPTRRNIQMALHWLVQGCQSGDSLVFHFSGHGSRARDTNGDEIDGYDEVLCPVDYKAAGKIVDDEINATIVRPLPEGAKLHAIIDSCHSGTILDLQYLCRMERDEKYKWEDQFMPNVAYKGTSGGKAYSFSACNDHEKSGDTTAFTGNATGALTYSFIQAAQNELNLTYGRLLSTMRKKICEAQNGLSRNDPSASSAIQEPQLSSSEKFCAHSTRFML